MKNKRDIFEGYDLSDSNITDEHREVLNRVRTATEDPDLNDEVTIAGGLVTLLKVLDYIVARNDTSSIYADVSPPEFTEKEIRETLVLLTEAWKVIEYYKAALSKLLTTSATTAITNKNVVQQLLGRTQQLQQQTKEMWEMFNIPSEKKH